MNSVFIQFLNDQMLKNYGRSSANLDTEHVNLIGSGLKLAILMSDSHVVIPAIDIVESVNLISRLDYFAELVSYGAITYSGSEIDAEKMIAEKRAHFRDTSLYPGYFNNDTSKLVNTNAKYIQKRIVSTTRDLIIRWYDLFESNKWRQEKLVDIIVSNARFNKGPSSIIDSLAAIPSKLDGRAFLWDVLIDINALHGVFIDKSIDTAARILLGRLWLISHLDEYNSALFYDFPGLGSLDCNLSQKGYPFKLLSFRYFSERLAFFGLTSLLSTVNVEDFWRVKHSAAWHTFKKLIQLFPENYNGINLSVVEKKWLQKKSSRLHLNRYPTFTQIINKLESILECAPAMTSDDITLTTVESKTNLNLKETNKFENMDLKTTDMPRPKVFIVHGWKHDIRDKLALYLEKLDLSAVIMQDEPIKGRTLPEKFESLANDADYAIILATADELLKDTSTGKEIHRMRPNVLIEIGFFWGLLGRERVSILIEPDVDVEIPTDLQGIGYNKITSDFDAVKYRIRQELLAVGLIK